jgi:hypothetical protein
MPEGLPMLMGRAYEGDETRQLVVGCLVAGKAKWKFQLNYQFG